MDKNKLRELLIKNVGENKVEILDKGKDQLGRFFFLYEDPFTGKQDKFYCASKQELNEAIDAFGGMNTRTVALNEEYLSINEKWTKPKEHFYGHEVRHVVVTARRHREIEETENLHFPANCGLPYLPGAKEGRKQEIIYPTKYHQELTVGKKFAYFTKLQVFKNWIERWLWYIEKKELNTFVQEIGTVSSGTQESLLFIRKKVGDGSPRMELRLEKINGVHYSQYPFFAVLEAAGHLACQECRKVQREQKPKIIEDCFRHLEDEEDKEDENENEPTEDT